MKLVLLPEIKHFIVSTNRNQMKKKQIYHKVSPIFFDFFLTQIELIELIGSRARSSYKSKFSVQRSTFVIPWKLVEYRIMNTDLKRPKLGSPSKN